MKLKKIKKYKKDDSPPLERRIKKKWSYKLIKKFSKGKGDYNENDKE